MQRLERALPDAPNGDGRGSRIEKPKAEGEMMGFERFVGTHVVTKVEILSDRRGVWIPAGTTLFVHEMVGDQHFNLNWVGTNRRAASQVHYSKLMTG